MMYVKHREIPLYEPAMRDELKPPSIDPEKLRLLTSLGNQAISALDSRKPYDVFVKQFSEIAGTPVDISELGMAADEINLEEFVRSLMVPRATLRDDVTETDLIEIVAAFKNGKIPDHEIQYWVLLLELHLPSTDVWDLVAGGAETATAEEYIAMARERRPILL